MTGAWDEWLATLPKDKQDAAGELRDRFEGLGAEDPEGWTRSEISENIPQLVRFLILRTILRQAVDSWARAGALTTIPAAQRLLAAGADPGDLLGLVQSTVHDTVFAVLECLDGGRDTEASEEHPGWSLVEVGGAHAGPSRRIEGLHEALQP
jgi:hypothetical protein